MATSTVLDYDAREQRAYWSDVRTQAIKRAFINGTGVETFVSAGSVSPPPMAPWVLLSLLRILSPGVFPSLGHDSCSPRNQPVPSLEPPDLCPANTQPQLPLCPQTCRAHGLAVDWVSRNLFWARAMTPTRSRSNVARLERLLQECGSAGPGAAPRAGRPPSAWVCPAGPQVEGRGVWGGGRRGL